MGLGKSRVQLQGTAVINQRFGVLPFREAGIALLKEFLGILFAAYSKDCQSQGQC